MCLCLSYRLAFLDFELVKAAVSQVGAWAPRPHRAVTLFLGSLPCAWGLGHGVFLADSGVSCWGPSGFGTTPTQRVPVKANFNFLQAVIKLSRVAWLMESF